MGHQNVKSWERGGKQGPRPCDWCGCPLATEKSIHDGTCAHCGRRCLREEERFYVQLGYDGESDQHLPPGYNIVIPKMKGNT